MLSNQWTRRGSHLLSSLSSAETPLCIITAGGNKCCDIRLLNPLSSEKCILSRSNLPPLPVSLHRCCNAVTWNYAPTGCLSNGHHTSLFIFVLRSYKVFFFHVKLKLKTDKKGEGWFSNIWSFLSPRCGAALIFLLVCYKVVRSLFVQCFPALYILCQDTSPCLSIAGPFRVFIASPEWHSGDRQICANRCSAKTKKKTVMRETCSERLESSYRVIAQYYANVLSHTSFLHLLTWSQTFL